MAVSARPQTTRSTTFDAQAQGRDATAEPAELQRHELEFAGRHQPVSLTALCSALNRLRQDDGKGVEAPAPSCIIHHASVGDGAGITAQRDRL